MTDLRKYMNLIRESSELPIKTKILNESIDGSDCLGAVKSTLQTIVENNPEITPDEALDDLRDCYRGENDYLEAIDDNMSELFSYVEDYSPKVLEEVHNPELLEKELWKIFELGKAYEKTHKTHIFNSATDIINKVKSMFESKSPVNEHLKKDASVGDYIADFEASKNPMFDGESKEKRKQRAIAAYYKSKRK